ncbi:helix-turn-helix domain-containing protein [Candidatus Micrarchaeota archaeon]|nr:helix-turn-helix domain-containing protein [Candidatus Micrarchaeota archaeon]
MWVAEFRVWHESSHVLSLTKKFNVTVHSVYLSLYKKGRRTLINKVFSVNGPDAQKYIAEMKKGHQRYRVRHVEQNYVFFSIPLDPHAISYHALVLDDETFFVRPFVLKGGYEYWTVASWNKNALTQLYKKTKAAGEASSITLLSLKKTRVDLFVPDALQRLGAKQAQVLQSAVFMGYYGYPRKLSLKVLARKLGLSPATVREHLRNAEAKILPAATEQLARR